MKKEAKVIGRPFVGHVDQDAKPEIEAHDFLKRIYSGGYHGSLNNVMATGFHKSMGYKYDLRPFLKIFLYKQHGNWYEVYAPNITSLRRATYGRIDKIVEITQS